jgi:prepilin-type N-terminal cleavage/methylation domain-containing protein
MTMTDSTEDTVQAGARRAASSEAGFTLIEALCAIVILAFGLMAITNLMLVAASSNTVGNQATAATAEAAQQMEILKATPFTSLVAGGSVTACNAPSWCTTATLRGVGAIETRWQVTAIDPQSYFIRVRSEGRGALTGARSRAEFTAIRACTDTAINCPVAGPPVVP